MFAGEGRPNWVYEFIVKQALWRVVAIVVGVIYLSNRTLPPHCDGSSGKRKWCLGGCRVPGVVDLNLCYKCRPFGDGEAQFYKTPVTPKLPAVKS